MSAGLRSNQMGLQLFGHVFSSYTMKALIALYDHDTLFAFRPLGPDHPKNRAELARRLPIAKFPMLLDGETTVVETSDHRASGRLSPLSDAVDPHRCEGRRPGANLGPDVRQPRDDADADPSIRCAPRPGGWRPLGGRPEAHAALDTVCNWLDDAFAGRAWAVGETFTLADAAAAPALLYADWAHPIGEDRLILKTYRARLLGRPSVRRCVDDARPFRPFFPLGAPERD
jgi:glutathione S-transferase